MRTNTSAFCGKRLDDMVAVGELVRSVIGTNTDRLVEAQITVETDLSPVAAVADKTMLLCAINEMVEHSVESMPYGGNLTITLMDCDLHWELEIADSAGVDPFRMMSLSERESNQSSKQPNDHSEHQLDSLTSQLTVAPNVVAIHSGQLQTWNCPHGGTAHVMVIPHRDRLDQKSGRTDF